MKGLALCSVLFCFFAFVLVYAATTGFGARRSSFSPVDYIETSSKPQSFIEPLVDIESNGIGTEAKAIPAPEVKVTRSERRRRPTKLKPAPVPEKVVETPKAEKVEVKPQVKIEAPKPPVVVKEEPAPQPVPEPEKKEIPHYKKDVTDSGPLLSQMDADRQWRRETLARWRHEADAVQDGAKTTTVAKSRTTQTSPRSA